MLEAAREGPCRRRLLRRHRETLRTTPRGRELLTDQDGLLLALHGDMGAADRFDADAWPLVEAVLFDRGPLEVDRLTRLVRPLIHLHGWCAESGARLSTRGRCGVSCCRFFCQAEAYGLIRRDPA